MPKIYVTALFSLTIALSPNLSQAKPLPVLSLPAWATTVSPTANFYQVDSHLYRSEQLKPTELALLKQQHIDTIINLRYFDRDEDQESFGKQGIKLLNFPLKTWAIKPKQLAQILHQIKLEQQQGKNVLVHCYHGADRTGVTIAMYRILRQGWTIEQAKAEMEHGGFGYHSIWKNIDKLLTPQKVNEVKTELAKLEKA